MRFFTSLAFALSLACSGLTSSEDPPPEVPTAPPPPAAPEIAPEPLPSAPIASLPEWVGGGSCAMPQILDAGSALREADASGAIRDGLLLCEVAFSGTPPKGRRWDAFGGNPDPSVRINDLPSACAHNTHDATLSWQGVTLAAGDKVEVAAYDVDLRHDDAAGMDIALFEGWPTRFKGSHFSMTCEALTAAAVQARLPGRIAEARSALSALQRAMTPEPLAADWGWPHDAERTARRHIEDVAGHISWAADSTKELLANEAGLQDRWDDAVAASMAQARSGLSQTADLGGGLSATVSAMTCDYGCTVTLSLHNQGGQTTLTPGGDLEAWLITPRGRDVDLTVAEDLPDGVLTLTSGQQTVLHLSQSTSDAIDRSMIRIKASNRHHLLPIPGN